MNEPRLRKKRSLMDKSVKEQRKVLVIATAFLVTLFFGSPYALLTNFNKTKNDVVNISTGNMDATVTSDKDITLNGKVGETDESGLNNADPVKITVTNTGNIKIAKYIVKLVHSTQENVTSNLNYQYIRYAVSNDGTNYTIPRSLSESSNVIYIGYDLGIENNNKTKDFYLKIWLDENSESSVINQQFTGSVSVDLESSDSDISKIFADKSKNVSYIKNYTTEIITNNPTYTTNDTLNLNKKDVYYFTGEGAKENGNVLFAGYCWQIIRTTDNGGLKLLYNGVAENNQCKTDRNASGTLKGINGGGNQTISDLNTTTTYGTGFNYTNDGFTLTGVVTNKTWSTDYKDLIGMYTCKGTNTTCSTISQIGRFESNTSAKGATYTIGTLEDKYTIGTSPFNGLYDLPVYIGFMYNKVYSLKDGVKENNYYANDVTYNTENNLYTLVGTVLASAPNTTYHYMCDNSDATTCSKVRYYITLDNNVYKYITLENGETIEDALYNMINYKSNQTNDANLNVYNSSIKAYLESWYSQNLNNYLANIDTATTYCNERTVTNLGGLDKNEEFGSSLVFINKSTTRANLSCPNTLDKFSVENGQAKLNYPIGLITEPERNIMDGAAGDGVESKYYWGSSPHYFGYGNANVRIVNSVGDAYNYSVGAGHGARPVITLSPTSSFSEGNGTYESPYVVGEKITRTIS